MTEEITPAHRFDRTRVRHRLTARNIAVAAISKPVEPFVRLTFAGADLADFVSEGPGDHARLFFPHPVTGELVAPTPVGPGEDGIERPDAPMFPRDFTPLNVRTDETTGGRVFDVDFLMHTDPGPASAWAASANVGDELVVVGPRGSVTAPQGADRVLLVADPSAFPAAARWITEVPASCEVEVIADASPADLEWVGQYLREQGGRDDIVVTEVYGSLADAAGDAGIDEGTYVFAAGEASRLVPLRRLLKYELELPRTQYQISGYWKRGMANFDHHAPIDPEDPED
ncbi:MAG: siderophore-interacting protein [Leucobacter sp.]